MTRSPIADRRNTRHLCRLSGLAPGQDDQALGRSRGGFSTKIHLKVDLDGLPLAFHLTGGEASDSRNFELLLDIGPDIVPRAAITDKGYDAKSNRDGARKRGICPVIPHRATATDRPAFFPKILYKARARIEQAVGKLKRFKRYRPPLREDRAQLRLLRSAGPRSHLDQIRPHGSLLTLFFNCLKRRKVFAVVSVVSEHVQSNGKGSQRVLLGSGFCSPKRELCHWRRARGASAATGAAKSTGV